MSEIEKPVTYWQIVWKQFRQQTASNVGLVLVGGFFFFAMFAPFLAHRLPLVWTDAHGVTSYPLLREFFAPVISTEVGLETAFNIMLMFAPLTFVILKFFKKIGWAKAMLIAATLTVIPFSTTKGVNDPTEYVALEKSGEGSGVFSIINYGPMENRFGVKVPPTWWDKEQTKAGNYHVFGTDESGRDVFVRMIHGARVSLAVGFVAIAITTILGIIIGATAGYFGGTIDMIISRIIEIMICFPTLFLILTIIAILDTRSIVNIMLVIGFTGWTGIARLVRGEVLKQKRLDYVASAIATGAKSSRVIFRHIMPNCLAPVLVSVSFGIAGAILMESTLSFLGFGVAPPTATWGELLTQSRESPLINWWLIVFPGLVIFVSVTAYNLVGEGLRDALDPRLKK